MTSETVIILISTLTVLTVVCFCILLFYVFYKNKTRLLYDKEKLENEVSRSQLEIREEFMRNVGKELHDNIGQVLSTVKLQLSMSDHKEENADSIHLIAKSLDDIRNLSKVVDPDAINSMGFVESCKLEMERLDKFKHIVAKCNVLGTPHKLDKKIEIIIFRIIQESLNNCIKHAQSTEIDLNLHFDNSELKIILSDNGVGFDSSLIDDSSGSGLRNMQQRAEMIGASFRIDSRVGLGTQVEIIYFKHSKHEQHPNRNSR